MRSSNLRAVAGVVVLVLAALALGWTSRLLGLGDIPRLPSDLLEALRLGSIDRVIVLRTVIVTLWLCWSIAMVSTIAVVLTRGRPDGPLHRMFFIGVLVLGIGTAAPASAESTAFSTEAETRSSDLGASDPDLLSALTVGSSLVAAGLGWAASRWWSEQRRRSAGSVVSERTGSLLATIRRYDIDVVASAAHAARDLPSASPVFVRTHDGRFLAPTDDLANDHEPWRPVSSRLMEVDETDVRDLRDGDDCLVVHVGNTQAGELWCDLERAGSLHIDPSRPESESVVRAISTALARSPIAPNVAILTDRDPSGPRSTTEFEESTVRALRSVCPVVRVGDVVDRSATASVVRDEPLDEQVGVRWTGANWELTPLGIPIVPVALDRAEAETLSECFENLTECEWRPTTAETTSSSRSRRGFMVAVLGPPEVIGPFGRRVQFERSKSRELVVWLALHPLIQRRSLARDAMWPVAIKDATFSNITADVRRSMTLADAPPEGEQWLGITLNDDLPLHDLVECDMDLLRSAIADTRSEPEVHGTRLLRDALELVRGMPFAGTSYGWPDAISLETDAALLVVRAATMLADMYEEEGDVEGAYWALARGLVAVPGHEDLVVQRMRLHSKRGDSNALRREWDAYQRTLVLDDGRMLEASSKVRDFAREF